MTSRVGIDVGGTFTDVVWARDGTVNVEKTPSTPAAPETGVLEGLDVIIEAGCEPGGIEMLAHGTTVATNAVIERDWAQTALITNDGFEDVLEIGRQTRPSLYDLTDDGPPPVVERARRHGVDCRVDEYGAVETPLTEADIEALLADLESTTLDSAAVTLLFAYENPEQERRLATALRNATELSVSVSSEIHDEIREYERTVVTALNAAVAPVMDRYIGRLEAGLTERGIDTPIQVMQSTGGILDPEQARTQPVKTLLSGPAAGVKGAAYVAGRQGLNDVITMDMGGTSCDVALVTDGAVTRQTNLRVGGYPVALPMVAVHTIGAGGGSIGFIDDGGALRVGPESAGAQPGPVCYGRGGRKPTVTDAQAVLGRIDPERMLSTEHAASPEVVREVFAEQLAGPLGRSVEEAAAGLLRVARSNMEQALRVVSVDEGHDPREFGLVAFGGAGPLHAGGLAAALDIPRVVVPPHAGVLSALGLLVSDLQYDASTSMVRPWSAIDASTLAATYEELVTHDRQRLQDMGYEEETIEVDRSVDLRYQGQSFELTVPVPEAEMTGETMEQIARRFHEAYRRRYGHATPEVPIELVTVRASTRGLVAPPPLSDAPDTGSVGAAAVEHRPVWFDGQTHNTPVYERARLPQEETVAGPAVIAGAQSTTVVHPDQQATVATDGTLIIEP